MKTVAQIRITPETVVLNGQTVATESQGKAMLTELYRQRVGDYPKFFKMDPLSRLGFIAAELLLASVDEPHFVEREDRAVVLVNRSASQAADARYEATIQPGDDYFPSPADFVYTLPNIVSGEIAIRHHYHGETTFVVIDSPEPQLMEQLAAQALADPGTRSVLCGWVECPDDSHFLAELKLITT